MRWRKRYKKQENSIECFTYGLGKTLIHYIRSSPKSPQFLRDLGILYELLKGQRTNHSFSRKLPEWCHYMPLIHHLHATDMPLAVQ